MENIANEFSSFLFLRLTYFFENKIFYHEEYYKNYIIKFNRNEYNFTFEIFSKEIFINKKTIEPQKICTIFLSFSKYCSFLSIDSTYDDLFVELDNDFYPYDIYIEIFLGSNFLDKLDFGKVKNIYLASLLDLFEKINSPNISSADFFDQFNNSHNDNESIFFYKDDYINYDDCVDMSFFDEVQKEVKLKNQLGNYYEKFKRSFNL